MVHGHPCRRWQPKHLTLVFRFCSGSGRRSAIRASNPRLHIQSALGLSQALLASPPVVGTFTGGCLSHVHFTPQKRTWIDSFRMSAKGLKRTNATQQEHCHNTSFEHVVGPAEQRQWSGMGRPSACAALIFDKQLDLGAAAAPS
jgi:hypothetical protein